MNKPENLLEDKDIAIFDFDGVLNNLPECKKKFLEFFLIKLLIIFFGEKNISDFYDKSFLGDRLDQLDNKFGAPGRLLKKIIWQTGNLKDKNEISPGAKEILDMLSAAGIKIFVSSGGFDVVPRMLKSGLCQKTGYNLDNDKLPKKYHIRLFANYLNIPLAEFSKKAVYIDDSTLSIAAIQHEYKTYGLTIIGLANRFSHAELLQAGANATVSSLNGLRQCWEVALYKKQEKEIEDILSSVYE